MNQPFPPAAMPSDSTAHSPKPLTTQQIDALRLIGDAHGDQLIARVLTVPDWSKRLRSWARMQARLRYDGPLHRANRQKVLRQRMLDARLLLPNETVGWCLQLAVAEVDAAGASLHLGRLEAAQAHSDAVCAALHQAADRLDGQQGNGELNARRRIFGYNQILRLSDRLLHYPELQLVPHSTLAQNLAACPSPIRDYFRPVRMPLWLDLGKVAQASELWQQNMLGMLGVLYAASLPFCYTIKKGIPLLYATGRLLEPDFIYQRIYETGLMLDDVMSVNGVLVVPDVPQDMQALFQDALAALYPNHTWSLHDAAAVAQHVRSSKPDWDQVQLRVKHLAAGHSTDIPNYLWGPGVLAILKVRLLHAAMRFMSMHPPHGDQQRFDPQRASADGQGPKGWDTTENGYPINQEDMAFTLLTFGYAIPHGLELWGCKLTLKEKQAFLHLWRLVGHLLGIKDELLTDDWDQARQLFAKLYQRQSGASNDGMRLTDTLYDFLGEFLPKRFGMQGLGPLLLQSQLGRVAADWLTSDLHQKARARWVPRLVWAWARLLLRVYYWAKRHVFKLQWMRRLFGDVFHQAGRAVVDSWRDNLHRTAFALPTALHAQAKQPDARSHAYRNRLQTWRRRLVYTVMGGTSLFAVATILLAIAPFLFLFDLSAAKEFLWGSAGLFIASLFIITVWLPHVTQQRPQPIEPQKRQG